MSDGKEDRRHRDNLERLHELDVRMAVLESKMNIIAAIATIAATAAVTLLVGQILHL